MRISGSGITGYKTLWVKPEYRVVTKLSLNWAQLSNGGWVASDRLAINDVYKTTITVSTIETPIGDVGYTVNTLLTDLYNNRIANDAGANKILIDWVDPDENQKIFGCDIDYSSGITAKITKIGERKQVSFHTFTVDLTLIAEKPLTFIGSAASSIVFNHIDIGYVGGVEYTFKQNEIYSGNPVTTDGRYDSGVIDFTATIPIADMVTFRRTLATQRSAPITTSSLKGVTYPFGPTRDNTWSKNLKYISVNEMGMWG